MACSCKICGKPVDCGDVLCPICEDEYSDIYSCEGGHCKVSLKTVAQRIRRAREAKAEM